MMIHSIAILVVTRLNILKMNPNTATTQMTPTLMMTRRTATMMMKNMKTQTMRRKSLMMTETTRRKMRTIIPNCWIVPCWKMRSHQYHIALIG
jgi:hypothetical protein